MGKDYNKKYPYLLDGLSTLYAADENNNKKAAKEARKIAYMEGLDDYEDLLYKPKEEKATASTLLYKPTDEQKQPVLLSNNTGEPTREDFSSDRAYEEYTQHKSRTDPRRYVGETPTYMHRAPGTEYTAINKLNSGTEVIYTGNKVRDKNGEFWAEIECKGQRGWVVANDLRVTNPNPPKTKPASVEDETESVPVSSSGVTISTSQTQGIQEPEKTEYESGKVKDGPLNMRSEPGTSTEVIGKLPKGTEITYTGRITEEKDGYVWAEVSYDGKTGWVATEYLEEIVKKESANEQNGETDIQQIPGNNFEMYKIFDKENKWGFLSNPFAMHNGNLPRYEEKNKNPVLKIDENAPEELIVESQKMNAEDRTEYLNEQIPEWIAEDGITDQKSAIINWFKQHGATARYTGPYCLPIKPESLSKISQGFYGKTSHAGSKTESYEDGDGFLGAVDLAADNGTPVYSVLPGKVVYVDPDANDFHRVTVETQINRETYYLEYLHFQDIMTQKGTEVEMGTQIGTVGGWRAKGKTNKKNGGYGYHLDFRVYQFKDGEQDEFNSDSAKHFIDPFELFDFDVQYNYNLGKHDYH